MKYGCLSCHSKYPSIGTMHLLRSTSRENVLLDPTDSDLALNKDNPVRTVSSDSPSVPSGTSPHCMYSITSSWFRDEDEIEGADSMMEADRSIETPATRMTGIRC